MDCLICYEPLRTSVKCCFCAGQICWNCLESHLLSIEEPTCFQCRKPWTLGFIHKILPTKASKARYLKHFSEVRMRHEQPHLTPLQQEVDLEDIRLWNTVKKRKRNSIGDSVDSVRGLQQKLMQKKKKDQWFLLCADEECYGYWRNSRCTSCSYEHGRVVPEPEKAHQIVFEEESHEGLTIVCCIINHLNRVRFRMLGKTHRPPITVSRETYLGFLHEFITRLESLQEEAEEEEEEETMEEEKKARCRTDHCTGFLSGIRRICTSCQNQLCFFCGVMFLGHQHVCSPDTLATQNLLRSEAKECPTCGQWISKVSGCDQMWCVMCRTAFSWLTGEIQRGVVHNPHYFTWRNANPQAVQANPCAFPEEGQLTARFHGFIRFTEGTLTTVRFNQVFHEIREWITVLEGTQPYWIRQPYNEIHHRPFLERFREFRRRYVSHEITEAYFRRVLVDFTFLMEYVTEYRGLLETYLAATTDLLTLPTEEFGNAFRGLVHYVNEELLKVESCPCTIFTAPRIKTLYMEEGHFAFRA